MIRFRLLTALLLATQTAALAATDVEVVNNVDHPVPVRVQGGTVSVQNTAAGPLAVVVDPAQPVTAMNLADQSAAVLNGSCTSGGSSNVSTYCYFSPNLAGGNNRFILDTLTVYAEINHATLRPWATFDFALSPGFAELPVPFNVIGVSEVTSAPYRVWGGSLTNLHVPLGAGSNPLVVVSFGLSLPSSAVHTVAVTAIGHYVTLVQQVQGPTPQP